MKVPWRNDWRPPTSKRPKDGQPLSNGELLLLFLDSVPCVASGCEPPKNAPLTPEENEKVAAYLSTLGGPAGDAERARRA